MIKFNFLILFLVLLASNCASGNTAQFKNLSIRDVSGGSEDSSSTSSKSNSTKTSVTEEGNGSGEKSPISQTNPGQSIFEQSPTLPKSDTNSTSDNSAETFLDNLRKTETKEIDVKSTTSAGAENAAKVNTTSTFDQNKKDGETKAPQPNPVASEESSTKGPNPEVSGSEKTPNSPSKDLSPNPSTNSSASQTLSTDKDLLLNKTLPEDILSKPSESGCSKECGPQNCLPHCSIECCLKKEEKKILKVDQTSGVIVSDGKSGFADVTNSNFQKAYVDGVAGYSGKLDSNDDQKKHQSESNSANSFNDYYNQSPASNQAQFYPSAPFNNLNNYYGYYNPYQQQRSILSKPYPSNMASDYLSSSAAGLNYNMYNNQQSMMPFYNTMMQSLPTTNFQNNKRSRIPTNYHSFSGLGNRRPYASASFKRNPMFNKMSNRIYSPFKNTYARNSIQQHNRPFVLRADNNLFKKYYDMFRTKSFAAPNKQPIV